jgi:hypothetical protein
MWIGNDLYAVCSPRMAFQCYPRKRGGREVRVWEASVRAGSGMDEKWSRNVRQWSGGRDYRTLAEAKKGALFEAECVGRAILDIIGFKTTSPDADLQHMAKGIES